MALESTNLIWEVAQLAPTFKGKPQDLLDHMVRRSRIVSPAGTNFIFTGDTEPTSNVGPWLKDGTKWYVWDETTKRYVPQDISDSDVEWFHFGSVSPTTAEPPVWLRTDASGNPIGWYLWINNTWTPFTGVVTAGPTANRPSSPQNLQQYYDSDISALIWYERSAWRTVDGLPGDVKIVTGTVLSEVLTRNPGWEVLGASNVNQRGRWISQATKDTGGSTDLNVGSGIAKRAAGETYGETDGVKLDSLSSVPYPPTLALWHIVKT